MAWIEILIIILPASCIASLAVLLLTAGSTSGYDALPDTYHKAHLSVLEVLALTADTALTISLFLRGFGAYKSWKALGSVLPEVYLVILLVARNQLIGSESFWAAHLQLHSVALYAVRFSCAVVAVVYSYIMSPATRSIGLGGARLLFLGTLVVAQPLQQLWQ